MSNSERTIGTIKQPDTKSVEVAPESRPVRCVLSSQTYGPRDEDAGKSLRLAMMHAGNNNVKWISDVSAKDVAFSWGRNHAAESALAAVDAGEEIDYVVWVDSDIVLEPNTLTKLVWTAASHGYDFVTGVYHQRGRAAKPVIYDCQKKWFPRALIFTNCVTYPQNTIAPMGGCGFGICVTSVKMLQSIKNSRYWHEVGKWFPDTRDIKGGSGEDLAFCEKAIQCGYQLYVHTGIQVGHQGKRKVYTQQDFNENVQRAIQKAKEAGPTV
jgi:glycosyltransferase involved in cell wall biosynthesis